MDFRDEGFYTNRDYEEHVEKAIQATIQWYDKQPNGPKAWKRYYEVAKGNHYSFQADVPGLELPTTDDPNTAMTVNIIGSDIEQYHALYTHREVSLEAEPDLPQYVQNGRIASYFLSYFWRELKVQRQYEICELDRLITGMSVASVGYNLTLAESKNVKRLGKILRPEEIKVDSPFARRIAPANFCFDPEAADHSLSTASFAFETFYMTGNQIAANPTFIESAMRRLLSGDLRTEAKSPFWRDYDPTMQSSLNPYNYESSRSMRYECYDWWDWQFGKHMVYAKGLDEPLFSEDWGPGTDKYDYLEGLPFVVGEFIPDPNSRFAIGLVRWLLDAQNELNRNRSQMCEYRRRIANQMFNVDISKLHPDVKMEDVIKGEMGAMIPTNNGVAVTAVQVPALSSSIFELDQVFLNDIRNQDGLKGLASGESVEPRVPATGVSAHVQFVNAKIKHKMKKGNIFIEDIGRQWMQHMQKHLTKPRAVKIMGPEGMSWMTRTDERGNIEPILANAEDIQGEFGIRVRARELPEVDPATERREKLSFVQSQLQSAQFLMQVQPEAVPDFLELNREVADSLNFKNATQLFPGLIAPRPTIPANVAPQPRQTELPAEQGPIQQVQSEAVSPASEAQGPVGAESLGQQV